MERLIRAIEVARRDNNYHIPVEACDQIICVLKTVNSFVEGNLTSDELLESLSYKEIN